MNQASPSPFRSGGGRNCVKGAGALLVLVVCLLLAPPVSAGDVEAAKAKFQIGVSMFQKENYPAALKAFEDSYRLNRKVSVRYNIAMCQKALFRYVDAIRTFEKYLKEGEGRIPKDKQQKAETAVREMTLLVGTLTVDSPQEGAEILLDGEKVGITPIGKPVSVDPGEHTVHVVKPGYDSFEKKISMESGALVTVRADLEPLVAKLIIDCRAEDAVIKVDGEVVGGCPTVGDVSAGVHEVTVSSPSSRQYTRTVDVGPGGEMTVSVALEPVTADTRPEGKPGPDGALADDNRDTPAKGSPEKKSPAKLIAGIATLTVGAGMGVMGGVFTAKGSDDVDRGDAISEEIIAANRAGDQAAFEDYLADYNEIRDEDIPTHRALMIAGYAVGGALVVTGVVLTVLGLKDKKEAAAITLAPTLGGIAGRF